MRNLRFRLDGKETHAVLITQDDYQCMKDEIKQEIMSELRKSAGKSARAEPNTSSVQKEIHILLQQEKFLKLTNVLLKNYRELKKICLASVDEKQERIQDYNQSFEWFEKLMVNKDPDEFIQELKFSADKTISIIQRIDAVFVKYEKICEAGNKADKRKFDVMKRLFFSDNKESMRAIANSYKMSAVTIHNDKNKAINEFAILLFEHEKK